MRNRGAVLISAGSWPDADLELEVLKRRWRGLSGDGLGYMDAREVVATSRGRGAAARPHRVALQLPGPGGAIAAVEGTAGRWLSEVLDDPHHVTVAPAPAGTIVSRSVADGQVGGAVRSGARGEFGGLIPVRPATGKLVVCLRGHRLDLYGQLKPFSHRYRLHGTLCEVCRAHDACEPEVRSLAE